jgi:hypothetical protein
MVSFKDYKKALKEYFQLFDKQSKITCQLYELNLTINQQVYLHEQLQYVKENSEEKLQCSTKDKNKDCEDLLSQLRIVRIQLLKTVQIRENFKTKLYKKRILRERRLNIRNFYDSIASRTRSYTKTLAFHNRNCITTKINNTTHIARYFPDSF